MSNLKRYYFNWQGMRLDRAQCDNQHGEWVKFEDIKELLNTSSQQSTPCNRCGELNDARASYCQWCGFTGRE